MDTVIYRDLYKKDYERIKELIGEAFGFSELIKDKKFLDVLLNSYLQSCILSSSFSKIAEKDNKIIGIILGNAKKDKNRLRKFHNISSSTYSIFKLMLLNRENKKILKEFSNLQKVYKEIIQGKSDDFQGSIELFIVSKESRGLGVGKTLVSHLSNYMRDMDVNNLYLYTDNRCNYGFYDSQNFKRLNQKDLYFDSLKERLSVFLYGYELS